jgi:hypothetical protein
LGGFNPSRIPDYVYSHTIYAERHITGLHQLLCSLVSFGSFFLRAAFYQATGILRNREVNRTTPPWREFKARNQNQA